MYIAYTICIYKIADIEKSAPQVSKNNMKPPMVPILERVEPPNAGLSDCKLETPKPSGPWCHLAILSSYDKILITIQLPFRSRSDKLHCFLIICFPVLKNSGLEALKLHNASLFVVTGLCISRRLSPQCGMCILAKTMNTFFVDFKMTFCWFNLPARFNSQYRNLQRAVELVPSGRVPRSNAFWMKCLSACQTLSFCKKATVVPRLFVFNICCTVCRWVGHRRSFRVILLAFLQNV